MPEDELPDGLWEKDGRLYAECISCHQSYEWPGEPEDFVFDDSMNVCGGSPWCLP